MNFIFTVITFFLDQYSKGKARKKLSDTYTVKKFNRLLGFRIVYNEGAFLGILKSKKTLLNILTVAIILIILIFTFPFIFTKKFNLRGISYSLILGGALGNAYDRLFKSKVTDFFSFYPRYKIYFNIADFGVFFGAILSLF